MGEHPTKYPRKFARSRTRARARTTLYELEAGAMKALAHPKRLLVLDLLTDGRERNVGELVEETGLSQSNLSQNLAVMRTAGLLATRREGNLIYYRVTDARVVRAVALVRAVMAERAANLQFLLERAAEKRKERVRKAATAGAYLILAMLGALALFAVAHPVLVGGSLGDMAQHTQLLMASGSLGGLVEACASVGPEAPAGFLAAMASGLA